MSTFNIGQNGEAGIVEGRLQTLALGAIYSPEKVSTRNAGEVSQRREWHGKM
jgi:hypothetical protein